MLPAIRETAFCAGWPRPSAVGRSAGIFGRPAARRSSASSSLSWADFISSGTSKLRARRASSSAASRSWLTWTCRSCPCCDPLPRSLKNAWPTSRSELEMTDVTSRLYALSEFSFWLETQPLTPRAITTQNRRITPMPTACRTRAVCRSGRRTGSRGGRWPPPPPPPPERRVRGWRVTRVGSSASSKNDTRWLLAVRHAQYDPPGRGRAPLQFCRHGRTAGGNRRTGEAVRTADDRTKERTEPTASTRADAAPDGPEPRVVLGRYRLMRRLGAGGFGVVWLAHDERLDRVVAVKRIATHDAAAATRAEREAKAAARLAHPGIVALYESGRDDGAVYLVSELVPGRTLGELMEEGALSDRDVLRVGVALCDALAHAHGRGVVHRDVKPGNVMVPDHPDDGQGVAKLTDFGVARIAGEDVLTRTGDVVGTLAYMAPEQAEGREAGAEADLYALALVLYEALAGVNPVRGRGAASTARRVGARLPPLGRLRRALPLDLCQAIDRAVLPHPEQRGSLADLRHALASALPHAAAEEGTVAGSALEGLGETAVPRPRPPPRERLLAGAAAGALATAALAWLGPSTSLPVPAAGVAAAALVAALPRAGWLAIAATIAAWLASEDRPGVALVVLAAVLPTAALLRRG